MMFKVVIMCAVVALSVYDANAFITKDFYTNNNGQNPNPFDGILRNMEAFKRCVDQTLAKTVGDINEKQMQPVFNVIGDSVNRVNKAFTDLTENIKKPDDDFRR